MAALDVKVIIPWASSVISSVHGKIRERLWCLQGVLSNVDVATSLLDVGEHNQVQDFCPKALAETRHPPMMNGCHPIATQLRQSLVVSCVSFEFVYVCTPVYTCHCEHMGSKDDVRCQFSPSTLFEARFLLLACRPG